MLVNRSILAVITTATVIGAVAVGLGQPAAASRAPHSSAAATARTELRNGTLQRDHSLINVCAAHNLACDAIVVARNKSKNDATAMAFKPAVGYGAGELQKAYGISGTASRTGMIVVIGAGAYPTLESDLGVYRSAYNLPQCTTANGCFTQLRYNGKAPYAPTPHHGLQFAEEEIAVETALDVDMASAACPACKITSLQVPLKDGFFGNKQHIHNAISHFAAGVQTAHSMGANAVSISYGYPADTFSDKGTIADMLNVAGMPIVSSSGDAGFVVRHATWPQNLKTVTAAGGTSLYTDKSNSRGFSEVAWNGAGSFCTTDLGPAEGQPAKVTRYCRGHRTASDVSAVSDPYTGVAVYDSYAPGSGQPFGFLTVGGTSAASPFIAGIYARAPQNNQVVGPNTIYAAPASDFTDVTTGTNYGLGYCESKGVGNPVCDARPGWDGPTGVGTPYGLGAFAATPKG
jgi:subtilase family serine protease